MEPSHIGVLLLSPSGSCHSLSTNAIAVAVDYGSQLDQIIQAREYTQLTHDHSTQATIPPSKQAVWNLAPELIKGINPRSLLPHLMKHRVIGEEQQEYITNPSHTTMDCNWCIVIKTYFSDPNHVIKFIDSLADEPSHPRHKELAKMLLVELRKELPYFDSSPCTMLSDHEAHGGQRPLTGSSMTIADSPSGDKEGVPLVLSEHPVFKTLGEASDQNLTSFQQDQLLLGKLDWLQDRLIFEPKLCEKLTTKSQTAFGQQREIIHHGVVFEDGEPHCMILFNDFLLILQRQENQVAADLTSFEWFSDNYYIGTKLLLLHLITIHPPHLTKGNFIGMRYQCAHSGNEDLTLGVCSGKAKEMWLRTLEIAIPDSIAARSSVDRAELYTESDAVAKITNFQDYWKVSAKIICATGLAFTHDSTYPMIHCSTSLDGQMKLRTQVVFGRRGTVEWPDQTILKFTDSVDEIKSRSLCTDIVQRYYYRPDRVIGSAIIPLSCVQTDSRRIIEITAPLFCGGSEAGEIALSVKVTQVYNV